jgi:hypothetical protein
VIIFRVHQNVNWNLRFSLNDPYIFYMSGRISNYLIKLIAVKNNSNAIQVKGCNKIYFEKNKQLMKNSGNLVRGKGGLTRFCYCRLYKP